MRQAFSSAGWHLHGDASRPDRIGMLKRVAGMNILGMQDPALCCFRREITKADRCGQWLAEMRVDHGECESFTSNRR